MPSVGLWDQSVPLVALAMDIWAMHVAAVADLCSSATACRDLCSTAHSLCHVLLSLHSATDLLPPCTATYHSRLAECCLPSYANSAEFVLATTVDLRPRNDTGSPNNPPVSTTPPLVYAVEGCSSTLQLLVADSDQDEVRCREVETSECGQGGCVPLPSWVTVESSCTVNFTAAPRGEYYVSLVVEDFPVGSSVPLASVPLSFTVSALTIPQCDSVC